MLIFCLCLVYSGPISTFHSRFFVHSLCRLPTTGRWLPLKLVHVWFVPSLCLRFGLCFASQFIIAVVMVFRLKNLQFNSYQLDLFLASYLLIYSFNNHLFRAAHAQENLSFGNNKLLCRTYHTAAEICCIPIYSTQLFFDCPF